ncbi:MAG TPA: ATP-binding protein [Candidatus Brocadiia bacterium]|nr:ATP-binding protein [Candidatus Brocadiia bacterium]
MFETRRRNIEAGMMEDAEKPGMAGRHCAHSGDGAGECASPGGDSVSGSEGLRQELEAQRRLFTTVIENFPEVLYITDPDTYEVLLVSKGWRDALGKDPVGGKCYKEFQGLDEPCPFCTNDILFKNDGKPYTWQYHNKKLDRHYHIMDQLIKWHDGRIVRYEVAADITDIKRVEDALRESESRYRLLVKNIPQKVFMKGRDLRYISVNENYAADFGMTPKDFIGKTDYDFYPNELADKYRADDRRIIEGRLTEEIDESYIKGGEERSAHTVKTHVVDDAGNVTGVLGLFWDVTDKKKAEESLARSNRELEIRNRITNAFLTFSDEDVFFETLKIVLEAMSSKYGVFGYIADNGDLIIPTMSREVWKQCRIPDKTIVFPRDKWGGLWGRALVENTILWSNESSRVPEGHIPITRNFSAPISYQGRVIGLLQVANKESDYDEDDLALMQTMTGIIAPILSARVERDRQEAARRKAEEELRELNSELEMRVSQRTAELQRSNADLQQFAYVASHDLQEPLRMIGSYLQLIERRYGSKLEKDAREFMGYAVDGAKRLQGMINDLLLYSRVESKGRSLEPTNSEASLQRAIDNLQYQIESEKAEISCDALPEVMADGLQLTQLFQNLLGNAIKYRGEEKPRIQVTASRDGDQWVFRVKDNGIGIEPQYHERIFEIFQRLHSRGKYEGSGIGLALCRRIVQRHGGTIRVESALGQGSTFIFTLPAGDKTE